jgi:type II secretory pathway pseudopilin PulG
MSIEAMRRRTDSQSGFALISAMIFLVVLLIIGASLVQTSMQELKTASRVRKESRALNLAEAGIDYAAWRLYYAPNTPLPTTWTRSDLGAGSFSVTASRYVNPAGNPVPNAVVLQSAGTSQGWQSQVKVVGNFLQNPGVNNPIFGNALFSNSDLTLKGTADVIGRIACNGNLGLQGSAKVTGDARASGSITTNGSSQITGAKTSYAPKVPMPTIDLAYYRSIATTVVSGGYSFNGTTTLNGVTYVDGDCSINSTFSGTGIIVARGQVHVNGKATLQDPPSDSFAIVSAGGVVINGTCTIQGFIYTHNLDVPAGFTGSGSADITGGVVADVITCDGTLRVHYQEPTQSLPGATSDPAQFAAISWRRVR